MEIRYKTKNDSLTFYIYGELDECSASNAKNYLDKIINDNLNTQKVIFDLSGLSFMDSTGIGLLIGRYKKLKNLKIPTYIENPSFSVDKVFSVSGIYNLIPKL